ncbi:MAG: hypothetical protein ABL993_09280 [Vicinamibacterales bacterium]
MHPNAIVRILRGCSRVVLLLASAYYLAVVIVLAVLRIPYKFELERVEGSIVDQIARVLHGLPIFVEPSLEQIAYLYTPLYYYVSALASSILGLGFTAPRLITFASTLGCLGLSYLLVFRETKSRVCAFVSVGLFSATFRIGGAWFDLARVDMLYVFLAFLGLFLTRVTRRPWGQAWAGVAFFLAFFTKQPAAFIAVAAAIYPASYLRGWARISMLSTFCVLAIASTWLMDQLTGGWYWYYVVHLGSLHEMREGVLFQFWTRDLMGTMSIPCLLSCVVFWPRGTPEEKERAAFFGLWFLGACAASWSARLHTGGYINTVIPAYLAVCVAGTLGLHRMSRYYFDGHDNLSVPSIRGHAVSVAVIGLLMAHFVASYYNPLTQLPSRDDERGGEKLLRVIQSFPGEVYLADHGFLHTMAGKGTYAQGLTVWDILRADGDIQQGRLATEIREALALRRFDAIILDDEQWFEELDLDRHYRLAGRVFAPEEAHVFYPVTGGHTRPDYLFVPR